jgi:hypothetical protein
LHPRTIELLNYLDATRSALSEAIDSVPAARRCERPTPERWSVAEVLEHLNLVESRVSKSLARWIDEARSTGIGPESEDDTVLDSISRDGIADRSRRVTAPDPVQPSAGLDAEGAWAALQASRAGLRSAFVSGDGLALSQVERPHPFLGSINIYQWLVFVGSHEARHTAQIREIATEFAGEASG